jgi:rare lipoprotein A
MLQAARPQPCEKTRWFIPLIIAALACLAEGDAAFGDEPRTTALKPHKGDASFYDKSAGDITASGEKLDPGKLTAASRTLPLGAKAKVTNMESGRSVTVTINDRGPYVDGRVIDVTPKAAERLGMTEDGVVPVKVQPVKTPPR